MIEQHLFIAALFCSQELVVWSTGSGKAAQVGVCKTDNMEVFFLLQMHSHYGHQSQWWFGVKQDHEGQHAYLCGKGLLQEQAHGDVLDLKTQVF